MKYIITNKIKMELKQSALVNVELHSSVVS